MKKKLAALFLALMMLLTAFASCSKDTKTDESTETNDTEVTETTEETTEEETPDVTPAPDEVEIVDITTRTLTTDSSLFINGENPYYDKDKNEIVFVLAQSVTLSDSDEIYVGLVGDDAFNVGGSYDFTSYPSLKNEDGYYDGAAIVLGENVAAGSYICVLNFGYNQVQFPLTIN